MKFDFIRILFALSYALDCVEHDVLGVSTNHGKRVAALAMRLADELNELTADADRRMLSAAAVMHDCALTEYVQDEFGGLYTAETTEGFLQNLGKHCTMGGEAMMQMPFDSLRIREAVLYHHENADGSGPFGKTSEDIPFSARLLQIADTVDACFDLSFLDDEKRARIKDYLAKETGRLFAPQEAQALLALLDDAALHRLSNDSINDYLQSLLPGGSIDCSPAQLVRFADVFARIVDYKSPFTRRHSLGIAQKAHAMAQVYGADAETAAKLYFAGALHDIGKLVVDRDVLEKPGKLTADEYRHIQTHAYYTHQILSGVPGIEDLADWASNHHEKLDGSGYPFGMTGERLGLWERLMACLDIYQALTEERPYKKQMPHAEAMGLLKEMADSGKLDAKVVHDIDLRFGSDHFSNVAPAR